MLYLLLDASHIIICLGAVIAHLHKSFPNWTFKAFVRNERAVNVVNQYLNTDLDLPKIETIIGSLDDADRIADLAYEADIVINVADSDSVPLRDGLLRGLKRRFEDGKGVGSFIHTSGAAIYWDGAQDGKFNDQGKVWTVWPCFHDKVCDRPLICDCVGRRRRCTSVE